MRRWSTTADCIVIGGGAAGMMAAIAAASHGAAVTLLERGPRLGRKLAITGKGRCNLTNRCPPDEVLRNTPRGGKFLFSALERFPPEAAMAFFEDLGVPLKTERGNRVFPVSDRAGDVVEALLRRMEALGVKLLQARAVGLRTEQGRVCAVSTQSGGEIPAACVVLATGGASYPRTGSTGDGYAIASALGHTIVSPRGSLVPLCSGDPCCREMAGLSLRNTGLKLKDAGGRVLYQDQGELLFTHFGLSGPMVLSASAHLPREGEGSYTVLLDLKPALDEAALDARILRDFSQRANRDFSNALDGLLPRLMIPVVAARSGIPGEVKVHSVTKTQRRRLLELLKGFPVQVDGPRPVEEAIITSGGVKIGEIHPRTMESKLVPGLFFAGEIIDADAYTGGFNLQIAWATGRAAGESAGWLWKERRA